MDFIIFLNQIQRPGFDPFVFVLHHSEPIDTSNLLQRFCIASFGSVHTNLNGPHGCGFDTYTEKPGYTWDADIAFKDVNPADYVALVIPGGRAPEHIRNHEDFRRIVRHFFEEKKPVAQLCHAPLALIAAGVLKSRRTAAYPALEPDVQAAGAEFVNSEAVVDGVMVSARAWPDHPAFMREFIKILRQAAPISRDATAGRKSRRLYCSQTSCA